MKANRYSDEESWQILARHLYDDGQLTEEQIQAARENLFRSASEGKQFDRQIHQINEFFEQKNYSANDAWNQLKAKTEVQAPLGKERSLLVRLKPFYKVAAALLFGAVLLLAGYQTIYKNSFRAELLVKSTDKQPNQLQLPDGTIVHLNTHSKISYPEKFEGSLREIQVEGEAFFDVVPNKSKPFVIRAGNAQIKVLGTSFNVNAYPGMRQVEVVVQTGRVQFTKNPEMGSPAEALILNPGDRGICDCTSNSLQKSTNEDINFDSWKTHILIFKATPLSEVIQTLKKVYNVNIRLDDPELNKRLFTTQFNNGSLDFILKVIAETYHLEVSRVNDEYFLKARS